MTTLADKNLNPGNLKDPQTGQFRQFNSEADGYSALMNDLQAKVNANPNSTLYDFSQKYAPASDSNDPAQYTVNLANKLGIDPTTKLSDLQSRIPEWAQAVASNEGYTPANGFKTQATQTQKVIQLQAQNKTTPLTSSTNQDQSLGGQINSRFSDIGTGISSLFGGNSATGQTRASGLLQTVGGAAGIVGDVVNKGIELIPGVKAIEGVIGQGVGDLAKTPVGQSIVKSIQDFSTAHPELSKDIGAGFNILTAIPILKGLGVVKNVALDGASSVLKEQAEKTFAKESSSVIGKSATGSEFIRTNPNVVKDMIDERLMPDIKGTVYDATESMNKSESLLKDLNSKIKTSLNDPKYTTVAENPKTIFDNVLNGYTDRNGNVVKGFSDSNFTSDDIMQNGRDLTPQNGKIWDKFEAGQANMSDINKLRSDLDQAVQSVYTSEKLPPITKRMGSELSGAMRDFVQSNAPETQGDFSRMSKIYKIQKGLDFMNTKPVKPGLIGGYIKGATSGAPFAGHIGNRVASKLAGTTVGILKRTGEDASRIALSEVKKKGLGLVKNALLQKSGKGLSNTINQ